MWMAFPSEALEAILSKAPTTDYIASTSLEIPVLLGQYLCFPGSDSQQNSKISQSAVWSSSLLFALVLTLLIKSALFSLSKPWIGWFCYFVVSQFLENSSIPWVIEIFPKPSEYVIIRQHLATYIILRSFWPFALIYKQVVNWPCSEAATQLLHLHTLCTMQVNTVFFLII